MQPRVITPPDFEQIELADARDWLNLDTYDSPPTHPHDTLIERLITAARSRAELFTQRRIATQTLQLTLDSFPCGGSIELPGSPIQSVLSVKYDDSDGVEQTLDPASYTLDNEREPGWLMPAYDYVWPTTRSQPNALRVRYVAGYTDPAGVSPAWPCPEDVRTGMLELIAHWYENRGEAVTGTIVTAMPMVAEALLRPHRISPGF